MVIYLQKPVHAKIVIYVNPCKPPYSILALQRLWKDTRITVSSYLHSTATAPIPLIFRDTPISDIESNINVLELTLIWKDGKIKLIDLKKRHPYNDKQFIR